MAIAAGARMARYAAKTRFAYFIEMIQARFWVIPVSIAIAMLGSLALFLSVPAPENGFLTWFLVFKEASPDGALRILASISTAVMTVVGVLFSVTIVVLQQVSSQYSPRVIDAFIKSVFTQTVLGFYIGTFGYSLLLLRVIRPSAHTVPQVALFISILFSLCCLFLLILYLHHVVHSIKASEILSLLARETTRTITDLRDDLDCFQEEAACPLPEKSCLYRDEVEMSGTGYLQDIHWQKLERILNREYRGARWEARIPVRPGDYLRRKMTLVEIDGPKALSARCRERIRRLFRVGVLRTQTQDPRYGTRQMVDLALRALSPGVNDPTTAMDVLNEIGTVLDCFIRSYGHSGILQFQRGCRIQVKMTSFQEFSDLCLSQIVRAGRDHPFVLGLVRDILAYSELSTDNVEILTVLRGKKAEVIALISEAEDVKVRSS